LTHARRLLLSIALPAIILLTIVATAAAAGHAGKTEICHFANHKYVEISVSNNAVPAHLRHGDELLDTYGNCP
jgi:hypothetical protein